MIERDFKAETIKMLAENGGFYEFADILDHIERGMMQSFVQGDTWVVTQINEFPRRKALEVVFVVGNLSDLAAAEEQVTKFAHEIGAELLMTAGRKGFNRKHLPGWIPTSTNFVRLFDGA